MTEKVVVLDRGNVEFLYPGDWNIGRGPQGSITLSDPTESSRLDVSYTRLPNDAHLRPPDVLLRKLIEQVKEADLSTKIHCMDEASRQIAWCDYEYVSQDKRTGNAKTARGRWLVGQNDLFQVLMTLNYWDDDAAWAVPAWTRIVETLQFGDGSQLQNPDEHWSMRKRN